MRQRLVLLLKFAVAGALVYWLVASGRLDFRQLGALREGWPWALAALGTLGCQIGLASLRWHLLLRARGVDYRRRDAAALTLIGWFFNQMVIGTTGGDLVKAYAVARERPDHRRDGVVSVFVDRAVGLFVLIVLGGLAALANLRVVLAQSDLATMAVTLWALLVGGFTAGCVYFSRRLRRQRPIVWIRERMPFQRLLRQLDEAVFAYRFHPREVGLAVLASFGVHGLLIATNLCLAKALLGGPLPWATFFFVVPLANAIASVPVNPPGAVGTAEALYAYFFAAVGVPQGGLICLLQRLCFYLWALPGALLYVARRVTKSTEATAAVGAERELTP